MRTTSHLRDTIVDAAPLSGEPERLVGMGFRCALTCLRASCRDDNEAACAALFAALERSGLPAAGFDCFLGWALAMESSATRPLAVRPVRDAAFGRDERLSVAIVEAAQHDRCPALLACIGALLGTEEAGHALRATGELAEVLRAFGAILGSAGSAMVGSPAAAGPFSRRVH